MKKLIWLTLTSIYLYSHPHFFIDVHLDVETSKITNTWIFDRINSRVLLFDFDKNDNNKLDDMEKNELINAHFKSLKERNYNMLFAKDYEEEINPEDIKIKVERKRINISFTIKNKFDDFFTMCTMDEKIYMAYKLKKLNSKFNLVSQASEYDFCIGKEE